jgi:hypothetical protein
VPSSESLENFKRTTKKDWSMTPLHGHDDDFLYELESPLKRWLKRSVIWFSALVRVFTVKRAKKS